MDRSAASLTTRRHYPVFSTNSAGKRNHSRSTRPVTQSGPSFFSGKQSPRLRTRQSLPSRMSQPIRQRGTNWPRKWSAFSGWNISRCEQNGPICSGCVNFERTCVTACRARYNQTMCAIFSPISQLNGRSPQQPRTRPSMPFFSSCVTPWTGTQQIWTVRCAPNAGAGCSSSSPGRRCGKL